MAFTIGHARRCRLQGVDEPVRILRLIGRRRVLILLLATTFNSWDSTCLNRKFGAGPCYKGRLLYMAQLSEHTNYNTKSWNIWLAFERANTEEQHWATLGNAQVVDNASSACYRDPVYLRRWQAPGMAASDVQEGDWWLKKGRTRYWCECWRVIGGMMMVMLWGWLGI
jgi:hypothetical protein